MVKPFNILLTDDERETLELKRAQLGMRSQADVIRYWIALGEDRPGDPEWSGREIMEIKKQPRQSATINEIVAAGLVAPASKLTFDDVRPKFVPRLKIPKPPKGAKR
jgi:hypothetical protein